MKIHTRLQRIPKVIELKFTVRARRNLWELAILLYIYAQCID